MEIGGLGRLCLPWAAKWPGRGWTPAMSRVCIVALHRPQAVLHDGQLQHKEKNEERFVFTSPDGR